MDTTDLSKVHRKSASVKPALATASWVGLTLVLLYNGAAGLAVASGGVTGVLVAYTGVRWLMHKASC